MRAVCLKYVPFEGLGVFAKSLTARGGKLGRHISLTNLAVGGHQAIETGAVMREWARRPHF
jgi:hypothetical protein